VAISQEERHDFVSAHLTIAPERVNRRRYPRVRAPKGMWVGWRSAGQTGTSCAENIGLGGLYLRAATPPSQGSMIELVFDLPSGEVRARALVRRSVPGKGMGIQFVQMRPEDRARLNEHLSRQELSREIANLAPAANARSANSHLAISPRREEAAKLRFEQEVKHLLALTGKGTYYQLLGVTSESTRSEVKKSYYLLARKFHPDKHVGDRESIARLKDLMTVTTEAYRTLGDEHKRAAYDKSLAATGAFSIHRKKTETEESFAEWFARANECLRAKNFVGSIVWLRKCVEAAPEKALYHAMLARSLATLPRYNDEAIEHFQTAIDLDPWKESVYVELAELFERMQLLSRARIVYSKLLEINPTHARASERVATLRARPKGDRPSALISHLFGGKSGIRH
jgi:tetratricopeptide (TPR) repeat protein